MARLLHIFVGADMRCRHKGLIEWLKKQHAIELSELNPGDIVAMLNNKKSYLALLSKLPEKESFGFLGHYKSPHGRVPPEAFKYIASSIGMEGFNMNKAIKKGLEEILGIAKHS